MEPNFKPLNYSNRIVGRSNNQLIMTYRQNSQCLGRLCLWQRCLNRGYFVVNRKFRPGNPEIEIPDPTRAWLPHTFHYKHTVCTVQWCAEPCGTQSTSSKKWLLVPRRSLLSYRLLSSDLSMPYYLPCKYRGPIIWLVISPAWMLVNSPSALSWRAWENRLEVLRY